MATPAPPPGAPPGLPPVPPNIATITSPFMFGILLNWTLFGVLAVQVYIYYLCFPSDKRVFKWLVYSVFVFETVQTILCGVDAWYWFCAGYGNLIKFSNPYISAFDSPMMSAVISVVVQWFFCYRIYSLSKSWLLASLIAAISLTQGVASLISGIRGHIVGNFSVARAHIDLVALYIWLIGSAAADTMVAVSMSWLLMRSNRPEHRQTSDILYRIVRLTVETNAVSAGLALISLILYFAIPTASYFICPTFFLGKIYSNTLLVAFNNRFFLTRQYPATSHISNGPSLNSRNPPSATAVHIRTTQSVTLNDAQTFDEAYNLDKVGRADEFGNAAVDIQPPPPTRGLGF